MSGAAAAIVCMNNRRKVTQHRYEVTASDIKTKKPFKVKKVYPKDFLWDLICEERNEQL